MSFRQNYRYLLKRPSGYATGGALTAVININTKNALSFERDRTRY